MKFYSTRDKERKVPYSASLAILQGLAKDGGLFMPEVIPALDKSISVNDDYPSVAYKVLAPYFENDELENDLKDICKNAFNFPVPLKETSVGETLELFCGPTAAFKDFGARFLAFSMEKLLERRNEKLCILVATSGDTGGAVASAFYKRNNLSVKVLFPKGRVADRQKKQLTCWDTNIESFEVDGTFDDCQKMVKDTFMDPAYTGLSSANSINLGRLLPQVVYYVYSAIHYVEKYGKKPVFIVPSGNVGNCTGAYVAKLMGAPIEKIVLAVNANTTIPDYLASGVYEGRNSIATLANAMDVGAPSNMERLFSLFTTIEEMRANVTSYSVDDETIKKTIKEVFEKEDYIICPHTAVGERIRRDYYLNDPTIVVSTAHPSKFESVVEPIIGQVVPVAPELAALLDKKSNYKNIVADYHLLFN